MCLPHCPTYGLSRREAESPRGRIALMQALARDQLEPTPQLLGHIDHCLNCRACEAMCPSQVPYGRLLHAARELTADQRTAAPVATKMMLNPRLRRVANGLLRFYQGSGLQRWRLAHDGGGEHPWQRLERALPPAAGTPPLPAFVPARGPERGQVALFAGCTGDLLQRRLLHDSLRLLTTLGFAVHLPPGQTCCGALHLERGDGEAARALAQQNAEIFHALPVSAVLTVASGCGATLHDYAKLLPDTAAAHLGQDVQDISTFLAAAWPETLPLSPLPLRAAIHDPCSLRHVLHAAQAPYALLRRIPRLEVIPLPHNERCCGAAGSHFLREPQTADALSAPKLDALAALAPQFLVTSNIGCALHLQAGLRRRGLAVEVIHPVSLLSRQLDATPP